MNRTPSGVQEAGRCTHRATAFGVTNTAQEITLTKGKTSIEIIPEVDETVEVYYGGTGVTVNNGVPLCSGKIWANCKVGFSVFLICATTATVRICEYD